MMVVEKSAKTKEEAIALALEELGRQDIKLVGLATPSQAALTSKAAHSM